MTRVYVGPTVAFSLGQVGELSLLEALDGDLVVPAAVVAEVTTDPARTALEEFVSTGVVSTEVPEDAVERAVALLEASEETHETALLGGVLADGDAEVAVVSEDVFVRSLAESLGATVTSTYGVVVNAVLEDKYLNPEDAKRIVRRTDQFGLHMTGELRERAVGDVGQ